MYIKDIISKKYYQYYLSSYHTCTRSRGLELFFFFFFSGLLISFAHLNRRDRPLDWTHSRALAGLSTLQ